MRGLSARLTLTPDPTLRTSMRKLPTVTAPPARREAVREGAKVFLGFSKARTPVLSGALRDDQRIITEWEGVDASHGLVGSDLAYARRRELGFSGIDSLGRTYNDPPSGFLRQTIDLNQGEVRAAMALSIQTTLRRTVP